MTTIEAVREVLAELAEFLEEKNRSYGDSAADPVRIFSRADREEAVRVRIDDKLSRLMRGHEYPGDDDILDLLGYLVLLRAMRRLAAPDVTETLTKSETVVVELERPDPPPPETPAATAGRRKKKKKRKARPGGLVGERLAAAEAFLAERGGFDWRKAGNEEREKLVADAEAAGVRVTALSRALTGKRLTISRWRNRLKVKLAGG